MESIIASMSVEEAVVRFLPSAKSPAAPAKKRKSQNAADGPSPSSSPKRRCKPHACLRCRTAHVTCGGNEPGTLSCKNCTKKGFKCEYGTDDRTNSSKKDELVHLIERFKETVNDYYNVICSMYYSFLDLPMTPGIVVGKLAREQCGIITPKIICQMLENSKDWGPMLSPSFPEFCAAAETMTGEGVKLNDTRKAINQFKQSAQDYVQHLHLVYRMLGERQQLDHFTYYISDMVAKNIMFSNEDFARLAAMDNNPGRSISPEEMSNIDNELNKDARLSTSPRMAQLAQLPIKPAEYVDLTPEETHSEGSSSQSNDVSLAPLGESNSDVSQVLSEVAQPAPVAPQPTVDLGNSLQVPLAAVGAGANGPIDNTLVPNPSFTMEEAKNPNENRLNQSYASQSHVAVPTLLEGSSEITQTAAEPVQQAPATPLHAFEYESQFELAIAGIGDWANDSPANEFIADPSYRMTEARDFQILRDALEEPFTNLDNEPDVFNWTQITGEDEQLFKSSTPGFDMGLATPPYQSPSQN